MITDIQEQIADDFSRNRRRAAMLKLTENLTTEDIELVNERFPRLMEWALNEILNESFDTIVVTKGYDC